MSTTVEFHDYVLENLRRAGDAASRKMMGEYLVYFNGKLVGNICDNCLYLKPTASVLQLLPEAERGYPYEGSKTLMVIVEEVEDTELMTKVLHAMYDELPQKKR